MKVCDAADWFVPGFSAIISSELHEIPRFDRKQWEHAIIFDSLQKAGMLRDDASGISFGAGREPLLYTLANHVKQILATDLYSESAVWPDARIADLDVFVGDAPPFPSRIDRLSARRMDMRQIEFPDESLDFAYSSSSVQHIGDWGDLKTHLAEVRRVLKPGGVYVMTTEFTYGPPVNTPGNMKFDAEGLEWWLRESGMDYHPVIDCRVTEHSINTPLPPNLIAYTAADGDASRPDMFRQLVHVQLLGSGHASSSVVLEMRKGATARPQVTFLGLAETSAFLKRARMRWEHLIEASNLSPHPAPNLPTEERERRWATTYMCLGSQPRIVVVHVQTDGPGKVSIGVNKLHTDRPHTPVIDIRERAEATTGHIEFEFTLNCDRTYTYAIYGRALDGLKLKNVHVSVRPGGHGTPVIVRRELAPDPLPPVAEDASAPVSRTAPEPTA